MLFNFYEVVRVILKPSNDLAEIAGQEGLVLGRAEEDGCRVYAVSLSTGETWQIEEKDLETTGEVRSPDDVYSGKSMKVSVDPETGEGSVKDSPEE